MAETGVAQPDVMDIRHGVTLADVAKALDARAEGDLSLRISGASEPAAAKRGDIALATSPKYAEGIRAGAAEVALLWEGADWQALGLKGAVFVNRPRLAMAGLTRALDRGYGVAPGVHPSAVVDPTAQIGPGARIGAFVFIGARSRIGANAVIAPHVSIGDDVQIGDDAVLLPGVRILRNVRIGDRFIAQSGAALGGDGFSFVTPEKSGIEEVRETLGARSAAKDQKWVRIYSLGGVEIGDDVEVGSNSTIDSGTIRATKVGRGTKIDNLVMIGHNVVVGEDCLFCSQVGVAGSTRIGDRVVLAGQVGVNDNIFIGDDVIAGGATKIFTNAPAGRVLLGYPAIRMESHVEAWKHIRRLGRLFRDMDQVKAKLGIGAAKDGDA